MQQHDDGHHAAHWMISPILTARDFSQMIYLTRAGAEGGGRGLWTSNVVTTQEKMGTLGL
jgi:hypothetical protein